LIVSDRGAPFIPEETAFLERFSAEYEAAFKMVGSRNRAVRTGAGSRGFIEKKIATVK
jgi:hypothetical protein